MDQVRYGIIGYGKIGSQHVKKILEGKVPSLKLCAVADTDPARIQAAKEALGDSVQYFDTAQALMDSGAVDAVHICTPHYLHPSLAIYALEHGLHTLVEKPAGVYTRQVKRMNETAKAHPELRFAMDFNRRCGPHRAYPLADHQLVPFSKLLRSRRLAGHLEGRGRRRAAEPESA